MCAFLIKIFWGQMGIRARVRRRPQLHVDCSRVAVAKRVGGKRMEKDLKERLELQANEFRFETALTFGMAADFKSLEDEKLIRPFDSDSLCSTTVNRLIQNYLDIKLLI